MVTANGTAMLSWEIYRLSESDSFTLRLVESGRESSLTSVGDLSIRPDGPGAIRLQVNYNPYVGRPQRPASTPLMLQTGETARLLTNGRYTGYSGQHYTEICFNAAFGNDLDPEVFLRQEPAKVVDIRANLF
jgi:hypothetical protein